MYVVCMATFHANFQLNSDKKKTFSMAKKIINLFNMNKEKK